VRAALAKIRAAVKAGRTATATITVVIVDAAGHKRAVKRLVALT
jgi:uncharacterized protein GlcG (DUF336 family)